MNERYQSDEFKKIFSLKSRYQSFLKVELAAIKAYHQLGLINEFDYHKLQKAHFKLSDVLELEKQTKHDVVAFTRAVSLNLGPEKRFFHYGLTSTDVVDTALALILKRVNKILLRKMNEFEEVIKEIALEHQFTPIMGRTHGMHADITTFGLKFALYYDEIKRHKKSFIDAASGIEVGKVSGAVGNYANVDPRVQELVCKYLRIHSANISTQVLQRDRHARYITSISMFGSFIEKISTEIRHLSRTEIREVEEGFLKHQKGSSAMPYKKNPIASENMAGLSRVLRGYMLTSHENMNLWHERDISHSSAERIILEDATSLLDYMLERYTNVLRNLNVFKEQMLKNIELNQGLCFAQRILHELIDKGMSRESAYDFIQEQTFKLRTSNMHLKDQMIQQETIRQYFDPETFDELFNMNFYFKNVDYIYQKVGLMKG